MKLDEDEQLAIETASLQFQEFIFTDRDDHHDDGGEDENMGDKEEKLVALREKYEHVKLQHLLFFTTLSRFTNLRILDFGRGSISILYNPHPPLLTISDITNN